jgi:Alpha amylase, catalytic domain
MDMSPSDVLLDLWRYRKTRFIRGHLLPCSLDRDAREELSEMSLPRYPLLYQINTRVRLAEIAAELRRSATLDDFPDSEIDQLAKAGFDFIWLLGVWKTGPAGRHISLSNPEWLNEFHRTLPDFQDSDVCGSCFAIREYRVHEDFGGDDALDRLRKRLSRRNLRLMLDFVPNHTALDHRWVNDRPDFYIEGTEQLLADKPQNYCRVLTIAGERILAHGRDPFFPGWPDTLQLNYANPNMQRALLSELMRIASQCDAVRCDMAMLDLPEVFTRTWGAQSEPFWPRATESVHRQFPDFRFMAEVYWDLEWTLQQQGFDYTYDKRLYDRLRGGIARPVREHLMAPLDYQRKLARFLENHDEPRAAATFDFPVHRAAAIITFFTPGLRFFHQGQLQGKKVRISMHLCRGPVESVDRDVSDFYATILPLLREPLLRDGNWEMLNCHPAWDSNWTWDSFVAFSWSGRQGERRLVVVNYSNHQSQCYVALRWQDLASRNWRLQDRLGPAAYDRPGDALSSRGLYVDLPAWGCNVFDVTAL